MDQGDYMEICACLGISAYDHGENERSDHRIHSDTDLLLKMAEEIMELKESK